MAVPALSQPIAQSVRRTFGGAGLHLPQSTSLPAAKLQGTPGNPTSQVTEIGRGTGTVSLSTAPYVGQDSIVVDVPYTGLPTPFRPSQLVSIIADAPNISLPSGETVQGVTVQPHVKTNLTGSQAIPAGTISPSTTINQFLARVSIQLAAKLSTVGTLTISVGGSLHA